MVAMNEAANLPRVLESVRWAEEIVLVDSGSTDGTVAIAESFGARVYREPWKGYGGQVNSALDKCTCAWTLNLDADEALTPELAEEIRALLGGEPPFAAYWLPRRNRIFGRDMRHGGLYPDYKLRLFRTGAARLREDTEPHATPKFAGPAGRLRHPMRHRQYPTLALDIEHMNRYSSASVRLALGRGRSCRSLAQFVFYAVLSPAATFFYNYVLRLGFLDGREGFVFHANHSVYVHWKYVKAWEQSRGPA
jgi:glycosyltransferase involved in cell wall biosynthesis